MSSDPRDPRKPTKHIGINPDEPVGFKNPPRSFQFKKGQSGNPMGRPKGSKNKPRFGNGQLMASIFISARRELGYQFAAKSQEYERAFNAHIQARRRRNGLPPLVVYPRPQDIKLLPNGFEMEIFGPLSEQEDVEWNELLKLERQYLSDRAHMRGLRNQCKDDPNAKAQLQEAVEKLDVFLKQIRDKKEKFRRIILTPEFEKALSSLIAEGSKKEK